MSDLIRNDYATLLADIKQRIRTAQYAALRAVNKELPAELKGQLPSPEQVASLLEGIE